MVTQGGVRVFLTFLSPPASPLHRPGWCACLRTRHSQPADAPGAGTLQAKDLPSYDDQNFRIVTGGGAGPSYCLKFAAENAV